MRRQEETPYVSFGGRFGEGAMTGSALRTDPGLSTAAFFALAHARLSLDAPEALTNPHVIPRLDDDNANPELIAAITAMRPIRTAAVLVPIIARAEPTVLFTQRTAHLSDHAGEVSFPGGKIDAADNSPVAAALREAEEEVSLDRQFVEPIGYLDVHVTPSGYRILPVLARVHEGFSLHFNRGEVNDTFEAPLAFLMTAQNHRREKAEWNGLTTSVYAIPFNDRKIWGVTAGIVRNLWERICRD
jgi:8-oxo-dGTP pyrophosphatase MutT (NUDIX family)